MAQELLNRDISWLQFNKRVSDEASKRTNSLAEQVMFHGITFSNLDEFMMVRYPSAVEEFADNTEEMEKFLNALSDHYKGLMSAFKGFNKDRKIIRYLKDLDKATKKWAEKHFKQNIFPTLLPITVDKARQANIKAGMYVLVIAEDSDGDDSIGYIEIPTCMDRFIRVPDHNYVVAIEDMVQTFIGTIIRGRKIIASCPFSILRSAEVYLQSDKYTDPYQLISETLHEREKSWITRIEVASDEKMVLKKLRKLLPLTPQTVVFTTSRINLKDLKSMPSDIYKDNQKMRKLEPVDTFAAKGSVFSYLRKKDRLCFHPYESYQTSMVRFLEEAAEDPDVVSIRICLYRVSDNSKIIDALLKAADQGKLVTVLVELKARFDEKHNMQISSILREGGVRIVYTKPDIKTHAKVCLVTRKEKKGLRIYSHIGTGNYSEANSRLYADYSYFTANQEIGTDLTEFFNLLTSDQGEFKSRKIIYAPYNLRDMIVDNINEQIKLAKKGKPARIIFKCNALTDDKIAERLNSAASAGVDITLIIRSGCIIQPKKRIKIYSIVGRFLEHSRVYVFGSGKDSSVYIGSSDMMTRNLSRRNELMILVEPEELKARLLKHLKMYLKDTVNRREILPKYKYRDIESEKNAKPYDAQAEFIKEAKRLGTS